MASDDDPLSVARERVGALRASLEAAEGRPVRLVETHISWVLLAASLAYKLKKPVRLPFLDFGTLASRRRFCEEELRLNRRLAPSLYLEKLNAGLLAERHIDAMAKKLADFHRDAAVAPPGNGFGSVQSHERVTQELTAPERAVAIVVDAARPVPPATLATHWLAATVSTASGACPALHGAPCSAR